MRKSLPQTPFFITVPQLCRILHCPPPPWHPVDPYQGTEWCEVLGTHYPVSWVLGTRLPTCGFHLVRLCSKPLHGGWPNAVWCSGFSQIPKKNSTLPLFVAQSLILISISISSRPTLLPFWKTISSVFPLQKLVNIIPLDTMNVDPWDRVSSHLQYLAYFLATTLKTCIFSQSTTVWNCKMKNVFKSVDIVWVISY